MIIDNKGIKEKIMAYANESVIGLKAIKKMIANGEKTFQGADKKYPIADKDGKPVVVKIEVKTSNEAGLYAVLHTAKGNAQKDYDLKSYAKRQVKKYEKIAKLKKPAIKDSVVSLILDIAITTGIRAGASDSATGILNLKKSNVVFSPSNKKAALDFIGKCGVHQRMAVNGSIAKRLYELVKTKGVSENVFDKTYSKVNTILGKVNIKDFRTKLATDIASEYVGSLNGDLPKTKKEYKAHVESMTSLVATKLGHKKRDGSLNLATAKKSYIDPKVFQKLSSKVTDKEKLLTKREREIAKSGSMWEKKLLPVILN